ncbi:MAG: hypothetical protein ACD_7C00142G0008 [uncultured bacterium]|nr:MAG: hypothetical protein ACD_7C00142G0008 [uncultured bacterium]HBR79926.1 hypothetical protein [Candidatus Moranbacteria bacterium]
MKLKILLVPVSVAMSLVLIIGYIYPSWFGEDAGSIKNIRNEIKKENDELLTVKTKKQNIEKLSQSLSENSDLEALINKYYPAYRNDEDVVSNINNIAFSEGVFLEEMQIEYKKVESEDPIRLLALPLRMDKPIETSAVASENGAVVVPGLDESGASLEDLARAKIKFIEATLQIDGNYEQIKRFATSLNKVGLLNNIQTFEIYKKKDSASTDEDKQAPADSLTADIVVGFGYYVFSDKQISSLLKEDLFNADKFNFYDVDNYRNILTGNYKQSEMGEIGVQNPFLKEGVAVQ